MSFCRVSLTTVLPIALVILYLPTCVGYGHGVSSLSLGSMG